VSVLLVRHALLAWGVHQCLQLAPLLAGSRLPLLPRRERSLRLLPACAGPRRIDELHPQERLALPPGLPQHLCGPQHKTRIVRQGDLGRGGWHLRAWAWAASPPCSQPRAIACWCSANRRDTSLKSARITLRRVGDGSRVGMRVQAGRGVWGTLGTYGGGEPGVGARRGSAASTNQCNTVLASTSKTRAVARIPKPSARQANTRTMSSTAACLPWKSVPCVSKK